MSGATFAQFISEHLLLLVTSLLGIVSIVLAIAVIMLNLRIKRLLGGTDVKDVEASMKAAHASIKDIEKFRIDLEAYLTSVENRLKKSVQSIHTVRFNPFKGTGSGSNQSFSTAFLNENGDGVVISSLYARDHVSVFSKPVKGHNSEFELSEEERNSLELAKKHLK
jgi:hypothetical protein